MVSYRRHDSRCLTCNKVIYSTAGESYNYQLYWGSFNWGEVEGKIADWIEYWCGINSEDIRVQIDGKDPKENLL